MPEYLVIDGRLDRAGRFELRRCRSTPHVREWPVIEQSDVFAELVTADDAVLHREPARVAPELDCKPGDALRFTVLAYIGLRDDASLVRLRRGDLVLWAAEIPPAPKLAITLTRGQPKRRKPLRVRLRFSEPYGDAHLLLVYRWGERRFQPIYTGPPQESLKLDLADLPGGAACRLVAEYSNGMRSASDATREFSLPPLGPKLAIVRPTSSTRIPGGAALVLEGQVSDQERPGGARPDEDLAWLVDGEEVGRGPIWSVDGLEPGTHQVTLRYEGEQAAEDSVEFRITRPRVAPAADWDDWDPTDERFR